MGLFENPQFCAHKIHRHAGERADCDGVQGKHDGFWERENGGAVRSVGCSSLDGSETEVRDTFQPTHNRLSPDGRSRLF